MCLYMYIFTEDNFCLDSDGRYIFTLCLRVHPRCPTPGPVSALLQIEEHIRPRFWVCNINFCALAHEACWSGAVLPC